MTDAFKRLSTSASDRYPLVRELGAGGMATVYYVMRYVDGESLRDRLDREKRMPNRTCTAPPNPA